MLNRRGGLKAMRPTLPLTVAFIAVLAAPLALPGCTTMMEPQIGPPVQLINALGAPIGTVRTWQTPAGLAFRIEAGGLPQGVHGIHVHAVGRCDPPEFQSAGSHWNPAAKKHGTRNPLGPHAGDLPNVTVMANGVLAETVTLAGTNLASLHDADGAALVLHAQPDDYMTDPSGSSGARIACAVL
jgi:Cu-Zn family superoxide dismutase